MSEPAATPSGEELELIVPADPALALTARMFAGAVAREAGAPEVADDLKLAFSELLASAVEAGGATVRYLASVRGRAAAITVTGDVRVDAPGRGDDDLEAFARTHRLDLLVGMFPGLQVTDREVRFGFDAGG